MRLFAWLGSLCVAGAGAWAYAVVTPVFDAASVWRVLWFAVMGGACFLSVFLFPQFKSRRWAVLGIWIPAIVLRCLLLPAAPSDDVSRYLWEGKLVRAGVSPYAQAADAEVVRGYRDAQWALMNHKDRGTAYPPLAELAFAGIGAVAYAPLLYKVVFVFADLLTLSGVLWLLRGRGLALQYSGFYALCPVVLVAYAGEGHFDALMVAPLVWALCAYESGRVKLAVVLASVATGVKWVALPLIALFAGRRLVVGAVLSVVTLLVPALFFWDGLLALGAGLLAFGGGSHFNGPVYGLLLDGLGMPRMWCSAVVVFVLGGVLLWRWWIGERAGLDSHVRWVLGVLIVCAPTVHFWYLAWMLPFVCLRPSLPWVSFSVTAGAYFFVWTNAATDRGWSLTVGQKVLFWGPFFVALVYEWWSGGASFFGARGRCQDSGECEAGCLSVAVVIPTLNAAEELPLALASVSSQSVGVSEVIVVDAGSEDETVALAEASDLPMRVVVSELGRGMQIAAGIEAAHADWVLVLHADAVLAPDAVACLLRAVVRYPRVVGGALGQRFVGGQSELLPIEVLNDLRALFSRTAFGDQVQFFHRETAVRRELMPKQPLMEDVEASWRVRECGEFLYLGQPCRVSHKKWNSKDWFKRFRLVMSLVSRYRIARLKGRAQAELLSCELYREYYPPRK